MPTRLTTCLASLALALTTMAATAAEWTQLPYPASSGFTLYTDPATEQPKHNKFVGFFLGNTMQAWFVTDYATPHRWMVHPLLSSKQLLEFDCQRGSVRVLARHYYEGPMAQGRIVANEPESRAFARVVPGDPEEAMYHSACARTREPAEAPAGQRPEPPMTQAAVAPPVVAPPMDAAPAMPAPSAPQ